MTDIECPSCSYIGRDESYIHTHIDDRGIWCRELLNQCPNCDFTFNKNK
jgi:uncharacterized C2H2 Zn-finger protein